MKVREEKHSTKLKRDRVNKSLGNISGHLREKVGTGNSQPAFIKDKSCLTNMIAFYNKMTIIADKGRAVYAIYINFSKVFDTVFHFPRGGREKRREEKRKRREREEKEKRREEKRREEKRREEKRREEKRREEKRREEKRREEKREGEEC
ncbi:hypothetical protein QYF61_018650, partial [Mycteria americana]